MRFGALVLALLLTAGCGGSSRGGGALGELDGRSVLLPQRFGVLSSRGETGALPSAVTLGAKTSGRMLLYFEFEAPPEQRELVRAQLLLSAVDGSQEGVEVEVSRADEARRGLARWSDQPRSLYPRLSRRVARRLGPERLDVTEILRAQGRANQPLCLIVRAEPGAGEGVLISTGAAGGDPPRLELYFR